MTPFERMIWAHENLTPVETDYLVAYHDLDQPQVKLLGPAPMMMAMLMHGGLVPKVEYHRAMCNQQMSPYETLAESQYMPPLTEREAIDFLAERDIPAYVNHKEVIRRGDLPKDRSFRNAWVLKNE